MIYVGQRRIDPTYLIRGKSEIVVIERERESQRWDVLSLLDNFKYLSFTEDEIVNGWPIVDETWEVEQLLKEYEENV